MSKLVEDTNAAPMFSCPEDPVTVCVTEQAFETPVSYLQTEFPSECWNFQNVVTTVTHLLEQFFVAKLPQDPRIEHVYWDSEDDILKVWTVIPEPDFDLETPIYEAQVAFMETFPNYPCDFYVIYRFGKTLEEVRPQGGRLVR